MVSIEMNSGTFRNNLSGDAAYQSFIPESLWKIAKERDNDGTLWHQRSEIKDVVEALKKIIDRLDEEWASKDSEKKEDLRDRLLRREAEDSVLMAYPRQGSAAVPDYPIFGHPGEKTVTGMDPLQFFTKTAVKTNPSVEEIPESLIPMAEKDIENLYYAGRKGADLLAGLPLSGRLLREIHYIALYAGHYDKMYRGEFRRSPVWIGEGGMDLRSAFFVPPVEEDMNDAFTDLEKFLHYEESVEPVIKAALIHYQFETIHPFIDGNGRLGRMLTLLYLKEACGLECPWMLLSHVLLRGIDRYYKEIRTVQLYGDYPRWTLWFLGVLGETISYTTEAVRRETVH